MDRTSRPRGTAKTIVVGVDGSEPSLAALRWALDEARLRGTRVTAVYVWLLPILTSRRAALLPGLEELRRSAEELLDEAVEAVADAAAGVEVERVVLEGTPPEELVAVADGAELLVLGSRGLGGFAGLLLGSVSQQCAHHARCPVVIVRDGEQSGGGAEPGGSSA